MRQSYTSSRTSLGLKIIALKCVQRKTNILEIPPACLCSTPGGCEVHWGMFSTLGGYHEYTGGCSVQWGDTMSTAGAYHDECGGYHEYTGGVQYTGVSIQIQLFSQ